MLLEGSTFDVQSSHLIIASLKSVFEALSIGNRYRFPGNICMINGRRRDGPDLQALIGEGIWWRGGYIRTLKCVVIPKRALGRQSFEAFLVPIDR